MRVGVRLGVAVGVWVRVAVAVREGVGVRLGVSPTGSAVGDTRGVNVGVAVAVGGGGVSVGGSEGVGEGVGLAGSVAVGPTTDTGVFWTELTIVGVGETVAEVAGRRAKNNPAITTSAATAMVATAQVGNRRTPARDNQGIGAARWTTPSLTAALYRGQAIHSPSRHVLP